MIRESYDPVSLSNHMRCTEILMRTRVQSQELRESLSTLYLVPTTLMAHQYH